MRYTKFTVPLKSIITIVVLCWSFSFYGQGEEPDPGSDSGSYTMSGPTSTISGETESYRINQSDLHSIDWSTSGASATVTSTNA